MKLNNEQRDKIVWYFEEVNMKMVDIAKIFNVTAPAIRNTVIKKIGEKQFNQIRKKVINKNKNKYHTNPTYRAACIKRAKERYRRIYK